MKSKQSLAAACGLWICLAFIPSRRAYAEIPVGLEAQGVSVSWALHNPLGLDVRDALARPVSARLVAAQIKSAQAGVSSRGAYASKLSLARTFIRFLDFLPALRLVLAGGMPAPSRKTPTASRAAPKPSPKAAVAAGASVSTLIACAATLLFSVIEGPTKPSSPSLTPLRC